jgi:hypothetical protein
VDVEWAKVLHFVNTEYATLFIAAAKIKDKSDRIIQYRRTDEDSPSKPWTVDRLGDKVMSSTARLTLQFRSQFC